MSTLKKLLSVLLVLALAFVFCACEVPTPGPGPTPPPEPELVYNDELKALDWDIFAASVTGDLLSYNLTLKNPEALGLEKPTTGWGEFSYESSVEYAKQCEDWLTRLLAIDRETLNVHEKVTYDTLKRMLESSIAGIDYYYYEEVLNPYNGYHTNLALNLIFYDIDEYVDVEDYLSLVEDTPRLMGDILKFEQEKAEFGTFMTDKMLDVILGQLQDFIDARETCYLFTTFDDMIAEVDMTEEQRNAFYDRNTVAVNALIDSYQMLYNGLEALRGSCTNEKGFEAYGDVGKEFYELSMKYAACSDITVEEAKAILEAELDYIIECLDTYETKNDRLRSLFGTIDLTVGSTEVNIDYLKSMLANYYPELPEHTITYINCPEELEDQFSPAAYLIPPIDDPSENLIILNAKTLADDDRYLDTLAHEGYPGHLYHYQYIRTLTEQTGYTRQNLSLTGYYEAWSQSGEEFFDSRNTVFPKYYCNYMTGNSNLSGLILPSLFSIGVNYYGWTVEDVGNYLSRYYGSATAERYQQTFYDETLQNPFYYAEYALGLCIYQQHRRATRSRLGLAYEDYDYNETYLNIGPTYFDISLPLMDQWADSVINTPSA